MTDLTAFLAALATALTILAQGRRLYRNFRVTLEERRKKQAAALLGKWTNEGDVTAEIPSHYLDLEIVSIKGGEVSGIVRSRATASETELPNGSFAGRLRWRKILGEVVDVRQGRLLKYGDVVLRLRRDRLEWKVQNGVADFLPRSALLWKSAANQLLTGGV